MLQQLSHEGCVLLKSDFTFFSCRYLRHERIDFFFADLATLAAEALPQIVVRDCARVVHVKVAERELQVVLCDCSLLVDSRHQEFRVVDAAILRNVELVKNLFHMIDIAHGLSDLI